LESEGQEIIMSKLGYARYEEKIMANVTQANQTYRDEFQPYKACHQIIELQSIAYDPTRNNKPRWKGQVKVFMISEPLKITLWQEDIDFLNGAAAAAISKEPKTFEKPLDIITMHCHPKFGLQNVDSVRGLHHQFVSKSEANLTAKALVIVPERLATPIAQAAPATVAQVEVLPKPVSEQKELELSFRVGDTVLYKNSSCKITHILENGEGGLVYLGIRAPYKTKKGASTNIIFRPASEFIVELNEVA